MKIKPDKWRVRSAVLGAVAATGLLLPAQAGVFTNNFNADPGAAVALTGAAKWVDTGGVNNTGYISITDAVGSQQGVMVIPEIDPGKAISGFKANFMIRIGGGSARPADGISFVFAPEVNNGVNFGEEGMGTGLVLSFDTWDNNGTDTAPAIDVKVGGTDDASIVATTYLGGQREGGRARPGAVFKDPATGLDVDLETGDNFAPVQVEVKGGILNVFYKGYQLVKDVKVNFAAKPGRFAFGGRTGGAWDNQWIDDLRIETYALTAPAIVGTTSTPKGFVFQLRDAPGGPVDTATVKAVFNGTAVTGTVTKAGEVTTLSYAGANYLPIGSTNTLSVIYNYGTPAQSGTNNVTFVTGPYGILPATAALPATSIDKTKKGFTWLVHQFELPELPNTLVRAEQQIAGDLGLNIADASIVGVASGPGTASSNPNAPIAFTIPTVINMSQVGGDLNGNFQPDDQMPGIPGDVSNIAGAAVAAIEFPAAGIYTMVVNSDDGFKTTAGKNPYDVLNPIYGSFDGGRGASDTAFTIAVEAPGLYPFRTLWEEGGGGANLEWFSRLDDGTPVLINSATNASALKAYLIPASALGAYVKSATPGNGSSALSSPKSVQVVLQDGATPIAAGSITLKLNGTAVAVTTAKTNGATTVTYNVPGDLKPNTKYTAEISYNDGSLQTETWTFNTGPFSSQLFVIEAEDFDYDGGKSNPMAGQAGSDVNVMPYLGGAYDGLSAIEHIDFNNGDGPDSDKYRTEVGDDGDHEVNIDVSNGTPGNGLGGTTPIQGHDRINWTMTANYRIGWVGGGDWNNFTRKFPTNSSGGWWKVFAALSYGGSDAGQLSGTLDRVTSGWGTTTQTTEALGTFGAPGSGDWARNNLVPMKTASGADAVVKLVGTNTVRFNMSSGDFDFILFSAAPPPPPSLDTAPLDSVKRDAVVLDWTLKDSDSQVVPASVKVLIDGQDVTTKATIGKTNNITSIHLDLTGQTFSAGDHPYRITFSDNSTPAQTVNADGKFVVNPYPTPGVFVIEAEDFNYSNDNITGGLTNPQAGQADLDVNVMPYLGGAYNGLGAVEGVDYNNNDGEDSNQYRTETDENGGNEVNIGASNGNRFSNDRGVFTTTSNYRIGWVETGSWQNYTRVIPTNSYNVWAALSFGGRGAGALSASLDLVTSDPTKPNQGTSPLGTFSAAGSGDWGRNELVPMKDSTGAIKTVQLGGKQTLRFNLGSGDFDYIVLVPSESGAKFSKITKNTDGTVTIEWTGGGSLEAASSVTGPWTAVNGVSPYKAATTGKMQFFRIRQ